jgi:hypothetical protein
MNADRRVLPLLPSFERVPNLAFPEGGAFWFDQLRSVLRGVDPQTMAEWSAIIEKRSKRLCGDSKGARIIFRGVVDEGRFTLDVDAADPDATLCLLKGIQKTLDLMPTVPKVFYSIVMEALVSQADEKGKLEGPWRLTA